MIRRAPPEARHFRLQRGIALVIALIAMVAMGFSAVALMRSVNATMAVTGNLAFRQAAAAAGDEAVEHAVVALFEHADIADLGSDAPAQGYFASRQSGETTRGIPVALQTLTAYPPVAPIIDAGNGNKVRYVIERMCLAAGPLTVSNCTVVTSDDAQSINGGVPSAPPLVPLLRQTIRVDGPSGATAFLQVWLADTPGHRRLSWRSLGD